MPAPTPTEAVACRSGLDNDLPYESCLSYCTMAAHCVKCKCKACGVCKAKSPPSPPLPPPPIVYAHTRSPTADALGCIFEYNVDRFDIRSFKAQVVVNRWMQGGKVLVDYGPVNVDVSGSWGADAQRIPGKNGYLFVMRHAPDEHGGFGFTGRGGFPMGAPVPALTCVSDPPPPPPPGSPSPPPMPFPPPPPAPPPSPPPPPPPPVSLYAPKRVEKVTATSQTCASIALSWQTPHAATGHPLIDYEVAVQRADQSEHDQISEGIKGTSYEVTGLLPATAYLVKVRARAKVGYGPPSVAITATTAAATRPPDVPFNPPKPHDGLRQHDCQSIELRLPPLRPGCGGDERLTVEMSDGGPWLPAVEGVKGKTAVVGSLDPYIAYRFRVSASNSVGTSPAGGSSSAVITDADHSKIGEPPTAVATSSASIAVSWASSPCRPQLTWEVLYAYHGGASASEMKWQTLAKSVTGSTFEVQSLRCPSGCVFRVRPLELRGLADEYSKPSAVVRTKTLPRSPAGALRIELRLAAESAGENSIGGSGGGRDQHLASAISMDLATALEVAKARIDVVEVRRQGLFFIFDLLPATDDGPTPEMLSHMLARQVKDQKSPLYAGAVTRAVDPTAPPQLLGSDGIIMPVEAPVTIAGLAARITFIIAAGAALVAVMCVCSRTLSSQAGESLESPGGTTATRRRKNGGKNSGGGKYGKVGTEEVGTWSSDDDVIEREASRLSGRR